MNEIKFQNSVRPKDYINYVKKYMENIGLQYFIVLVTDEKCIIRIEDNIFNISKFSKLRKFIQDCNLNFHWSLLESEILQQIEIIIN